MEVSGLIHALTALYMGREPLVTIFIGGWVGTRASLDVMVKRKKSLPLLGIESWSSSPQHSYYTV
jgi:hypothetical protein